MKISKSKRQLAQLLIDAGVKQFPEGASWAAQDRNATVTYFNDEPWRCHDCWEASQFEAVGCVKMDWKVLPNWHQCILSRSEFDRIVSETAPDADGWIEWKGGECPVGEGDRIDVKLSDGDEFFDVDSDWDWGVDAGDCNIIAYRPHKKQKSEPQYCESVTRSIPEPIAAPTLDQLLQDWRNADDFAKRKQAEAGEASAMRDERWNELQARAGEMGLTVGLCESVAAEPEQVNPVKPVMTGKFRNAKIGSPKHYISNKGWAGEICDECGRCFGDHFDTDCNQQ